MAYSPLVKNSTTSNTKYDILKARDIISGLGDVEPQVKKEFIRTYGMDSVGDWMKSKGAMTGVKNMEVFHKEKQAIRATFGVASQLAGGSADISTLTVATANQTTTSKTESPFIATGSTVTVPVRAQDIVEFDNGVQALVTSVSGNNAVVYSVDGSDIPTVGSGSVRVIGNAVAESADSVSSRFTQGVGFTSVLQRSRNTQTISGDSLAIVDWFDNYGESGSSNQYYSELVMDCYTNHDNDVELGLLAGKKITNENLADVPGQETTMTTEGYIPWLETNANVETYTATSFSMAEIDAMVAKFTKYRGSREYEIWSDLQLSVEIDDFLRAETGLDNGGVVYSSASKDRYIDFGFKSFTRSGITFHTNRLAVLNFDEYLGGSANYQGIGMVMPTGNATITADGVDIKVPACEILYQDAMGYTEGYREWIHGGRSAGETNGVDNIVYEVQSVFGFRGIAANRHGLFKTA